MIISFFILFLFLFMEASSLINVIILMIFLRILLLSIIWVTRIRCWFTSIFSLLFIGGILVIFIVISSLFPNRKIYFSFHYKKIFLFFLFFSILFSTPAYICIDVLRLKSLVFSFRNFISMICVILIYFFCFLYFISKDKLSLRRFF